MRLHEYVTECRAFALILLASLPAGVIAPAAGAPAPAHEAERAQIGARLASSHFAEPLVRTAPTTAAEDRALLRAIATYERRGIPDGDLLRHIADGLGKPRSDE